MTEELKLQDEKIIILLNKGLTGYAIHNKLNLAISTVYEAIRKYKASK